MGKYVVDCACGHTDDVELFGSRAERDRRLAWLAGRPCGECRRKARRHDAEERLRALDAEVERLLDELDGTPGLIGVGVELRRLADCRGMRLDGTERQVAWASRIRAEYVDDMVIHSARMALERPVDAAANVDRLVGLTDALIGRLRLARGASFWIDNRDALDMALRRIE